MLKKILLTLVFLFFGFLSFVFVNHAHAALTSSLDIVVRGSGGGPPGVFKNPFKCGLSYWGWTYPTHSAYSVDFNRGSGYDDYGDPVRASADGKVDYVLYSHGQVQINHAGGYQTIYAHMKNINVKKGDMVVLGQKIGEIGDVGAPGQSHLHYNQARNGVRIKVAFDSVPYSASLFHPADHETGPYVKGECP